VESTPIIDPQLRELPAEKIQNSMPGDREMEANNARGRGRVGDRDVTVAWMRPTWLSEQAELNQARY
jgi:hypothetical protein